MTTPLQLITTAGLYQNQGIAANTAMLSAVTSYENQSLISPLISAMISGGNANIPPSNTARLGNVTLSNLYRMGNTTCAALADAIPAGLGNITIVASSPGVTGAIKTGANIVIPADLTKFIQAFTTATGYVSTTNQVINTSRNSQSFLGPTFTDMNALTTGEISSVNTDISAFGADLANLGQLIDLSRLGDLGSPAQLLRQLIVVGGLVPGVIGALNDSGISTETINSLKDKNVEWQDTQQYLAYRAMLTVTGDDLQQVLDILDVTTTGIETMADLLNPVKLFPRSFTTFQAPTSIGALPIYVNNSGTVNSTLETTLPDYMILVVT